MTIVYLLHFDGKIGNANNTRAQAQHYIGSSDNLEKRIKQHRAGKSAPIVRAFKMAGKEFKVTRQWEHENGRMMEKYLKTCYKDAPALCPICAAAAGRKPQNPNFDKWLEKHNAIEVKQQLSTPL